MNRSRIIRGGTQKYPNVAYWMSRDQRADNNHTILFAQKLAKKSNGDLHVFFHIVDDFLDAGPAEFRFMINGLVEVEERLNEKNIEFHILHGKHDKTIPDFLKDEKIGVLVYDFDPLKEKRKWRESVEKNTILPIFEVDAHNIVPAWIASDKKEFSAYTFRKKMNRLLPKYLTGFGRLTKMREKPKSKNDLDEILEKIISKRDLKMNPGRKSGLAKSAYFFREKIRNYGDRNDPNKSAQSGLSPYLHFGQISAQHIALEALKKGTISDDFIEELVVRRELADNFCLYEENYDSFEGFHKWAKKTLDEHRKDIREYVYSFREFEKGKTHDDLWNAAQIQMVKTGKMHGYIRMYWAKKILEWTKSPEDAMRIAIRLNNRYELDGRDPNGYAGIAWSIGGIHDRAWAERPIFGKIRYMSFSGCKRKFDVEKYIKTWIT
jgi:deoxyribodipyrimidine photo-lyase